MDRTVRIVAVVALASGAIFAGYKGYERVQSTPGDRFISSVEKALDAKAPRDWKSSKAEGYAWLAGAACCAVGALAVLRRRA